MKKVFFSIALMLVVFTTSAFARSNSYEVFYKLNDKATFNQVMRYLQADYAQANDLAYVFSLTGKKLNSVKNENPDEIAKVLRFNLANAKNVLSPDQYKKYLVLLNVSVHNHRAELIAEK